ncbi:MAG: hypothetical protein IPF65_05740 [Polaromonas sp.]|jgi:hypothetical protein|nr:hypothetical protein [Polaromonas sp.]
MVQLGVFNLGRGLEIDKTAAGLAAHRQAIRWTRKTGIDVFAVPSNMLVT